MTECVTGVDLVHAGLMIAAGSSLAQLGLDAASIRLTGFALQARVTLAPGGASDMITAYSEPSGAGVRVDGCGYLGLQVRSEFDPLLASLGIDVIDGNVTLQDAGPGAQLRRAFLQSAVTL